MVQFLGNFLSGIVEYGKGECGSGSVGNCCETHLCWRRLSRCLKYLPQTSQEYVISGDLWVRSCIIRLYGLVKRRWQYLQMNSHLGRILRRKSDRQSSLSIRITANILTDDIYFPLFSLYCCWYCARCCCSCCCCCLRATVARALWVGEVVCSTTLALSFSLSCELSGNYALLSYSLCRLTRLVLLLSQSAMSALVP